MDRPAAVKLIRDTFENSFDKARFINLTRNLVKHLDESKSLTYQGNLIPDAYEEGIQSLERVGKYEDAEGRKIDILIVRLRKEHSLERARAMQRNFVAWYLNGSRGGELKDAALAAFVAPDARDWRFSLVRMDYSLVESSTGRTKVEQELTPARRYSFLVGETESSHTAQVQLLPILENDETRPLLSDFEKAFSIEVVTREFFNRYRDLFHKVREALEHEIQRNSRARDDFEAKDVDTVNFAKKLLGQVVFLYFLQKKGWFGVGRDENWGRGPKDFLRRLFEKKIAPYDNFFNDVLEPLFYEALALQRADDFYSRFNCKIPFLNGGLFDPINNYDWVHTDILLPNDLFSDTERTRERDIGTGILDVFDRYNFTVKEDEPLEKDVAVDPEMLGKVFENLLEVKDRKSKGTYYTPREIVHYMCQESLINYLDTAMNTGEVPLVATPPPQGKLFGQPDPEQAALKIPGHRGIVPRQDIEALVRRGELAVEHDTRVEVWGRETERYSYKLPQAVRWNAGLIDDRLADIRVCDPAIGSGAFPVGLMTDIVRARNTLTTYMPDKEGRTNYNFKRHAIQNCLYGVDIDPGAVEIAKLRLWLSLVVDEDDIRDIQPLPNLDYKIVCGNSLLGVEKDLFNIEPFNELERTKLLYFDETNARKKQVYKAEIDRLIRQITNDNETFDFAVYFSEVFHEKGGFDVVIANPPYGASIKGEERNSIMKILGKVPDYEVFYFFIQLAHRLLRPNGHKIYIIPNTMLFNVFAREYRLNLLRSWSIRLLLDCTGFEFFEAATIHNVITFLQKGGEDDCVGYKNSDRAVSFQDLVSRPTVTVARTYLIDSNTNWGLVFRLDRRVLSLTQKIGANKRPLKLHFPEISQGLIAYDKYRGQTQEVIQNRVYHYREKSKDSLKPWLRGEDVKRYIVTWSHQEYIDYCEGIANPRDPKFFKGRRMLIREITNPSIYAAFTDQESYHDPAIIAVKEGAGFSIFSLLAILNSKLATFYHFNASPKATKGSFPKILVKDVQEFPLPVINPEQAALLNGAATRILSILAHESAVPDIMKQDEVRELERQIDQMVYELYDLTPEEIAVVEGSAKA